MFTEIAFTIYAVTDMAKSRAFYEGVLGLKPNGEFDGGENPSWVEYNIGPGCLALGCSPDWKPSQDGAVAALEAADFDAVIAKLKAANVPFKLEPQDFPTCKMAVIKDPDMNNLTIHQRKAH